MSDHTVSINGKTVIIPPITGRKFVRLGKIIKSITKTTPEIMSKLAEFNASYERENQIELDRTQALAQAGPRPLYVEGKNADGEDTMVPALNDAGEVIMGPGDLDHLTDADWQASGNKIRMPQSPSLPEQIAAVFPEAFDAAEDQITRLLGLMVTDNGRLNDAAKAGSVDELLTSEGDKLLDDAPFEDLLEIIVVAYEVATAQYGNVTDRMGDRLGKLLSLFGVNLPTGALESEPSSTSSQTLSIDSEAPTDGQPTTPSTESSSPYSQPAPVA